MKERIYRLAGLRFIWMFFNHPPLLAYLFTTPSEIELSYSDIYNFSLG